ncbi:uncharacterized protein LOC126885071 [Diabrotica virgifera virgifera]|uniref:Uncharacterized protein n=1 Tax=Diabrotica virgifera virgifera TaxID=50390 RepID=A0ABM5KB97_DIAVI|nr:uncharacterized protein LOC126885071 [Diabrotica virgifera virgifera]
MLLEGPNGIFATLPITVMVVFMLMQTCLIGEDIEAASNKFNESMYNADWMYWNQSNKKMLLILLVSTTKPMALTISGVGTINLQFVKEFAFWTYKVTSVFVRIK